MGALSHLRIVEIGSAAAASHCARLLADFGILIDGRDVDAADCSVFDLAAHKQGHPGLIHVDVSW